MKIAPRFILALTIASASLLSACGGGETATTTTAPATTSAAAATPAAPATPAASGTYLGVLGSSVVVVASGNTVAAKGLVAEDLWSFQLPDGDTVIAAPAGALNSAAYVRGQKNLYGFGPDGKLLWQYPLTGQPGSINTVVALGDSTPAVAIGDTSMVAFSYEGQPKWTYLLPDGDKMVAAPVVAANSFIYIQGQKALYCVDGSGVLRWKKDLAQ